MWQAQTPPRSVSSAAGRSRGPRAPRAARGASWRGAEWREGAGGAAVAARSGVASAMASAGCAEPPLTPAAAPRRAAAGTTAAKGLPSLSTRADPTPGERQAVAGFPCTFFHLSAHGAGPLTRSATPPRHSNHRAFVNAFSWDVWFATAITCVGTVSWGVRPGQAGRGRAGCATSRVAGSHWRWGHSGRRCLRRRPAPAPPFTHARTLPRSATCPALAPHLLWPVLLPPGLLSSGGWTCGLAWAKTHRRRTSGRS